MISPAPHPPDCRSGRLTAPPRYSHCINRCAAPPPTHTVVCSRRPIPIADPTSILATMM